MSVLRQVATALTPEDISPVIKQSATTLAFAVALYIVFAVPELEITDWSTVWAAVGLMLLAIAFSVAFSTTRTQTHWTIIIPVISLMAIGVLRAGAGTIFTPVAILPIVWIAAEEGRRWVVLAIVTTSAAFSLEFSWYGHALSTGDAVVRVIFAPIVYGLAALVVNELPARVASGSKRTRS